MQQVAVYRHYDENDVLLYVGQTNNPASRWQQHLLGAEWAPHVTRTEVVWFDDRAAALAAEAGAIEEERPVYNIYGRMKGADRMIRRTVRVPEDLWARALATASERGETVSIATRRILAEYVDSAA